MTTAELLAASVLLAMACLLAPFVTYFCVALAVYARLLTRYQFRKKYPDCEED